VTLPRGARPVTAAVAAFVLVFGTATPARADRIRDREWWLGPLKVAQAQRITKGAGVTVAVVDSGVNAGHPDLRGAVLTGRDMVSGKNGHFDAEGHGTAMAGIIAARGRGGAGFLGIAPAAKILPVTPSDVTMYTAAGIRWATAHGAKVMNLSFAVAPSDNLHAAIREAAEADVVLVGAAGNTGNKGNNAEYPVSYPEVLGVGATARNGKVLPLSQHGPQVDLVAPGQDMLLPVYGTGYLVGNGTSGAAAIVSGAAALIRARHPDITAAQVVQILTGTATDRGAAGRDDYYGNGALNLMAALAAAPPRASPSAAPVAQEPAAAAPAPAADDDSGGGIPPLLIVAAGVVLLVIAVLAGLVALRRAGSR
jgi:type VII secretion-associated serine protease mycosin